MTITTTKSPKGRISVSTSGITGMDKVVNYAFDVIDNGEDVILKNEHGDTCTLDDSLFLHGIYNVKFAIRQFAKGERVTGAIVLNGKEYPVVKAEDIIAEGERRRAMREVSEETADDKPVWEDPHKYETVGNLEHARYLYGEFNADDNAGEVSEEIADDAVVETTNDTGIDTDETAAADNKTEYLCVNDDEIQFKHGKFFSIWSYTYNAGFYADEANYAVKIRFTDGSRQTVLIDDEEEFFEIMEGRGACTIDTKPTRPLVETCYFDGNGYKTVTLEQEFVNREILLFDKDKLLVVIGNGHSAAKITFLSNGAIAYYVRYLDENQRYGDYECVDEDEFWLEMADRGLCTLEPVNNELVVADYEFPDKYNIYGADTRRFKIGDEIITFYKGRWVEIYSPKFHATIDRSIYLDHIRYHTEQWVYPKGQRGHIQLDEHNIPAAKFFWRMYERGFIQRANPFKITIEHIDAPATNYEVSEMEISYMRNGNNYDVFIDGDKKIVLATLGTNQLQAFVDKIHGAFVSDAGIKIHADHTVEFIADEEIYIFDACNEINRQAPEGWTITFDTKKKFFPVKFNGRQVATLDSLATQKFLSPEKFFEQFKPLVDKTFTPKQQFLADRYNELALLEEMREEIANDSEQLQTLKEMIEQVKRDIAAEELAG